jgi:hypothetical protein
MKKRNVLLAVLLILFALLVGCGQQAVENPPAETYTFTDSAGRTVELPKQIDRIAPSGGLAQMALFAIAPDKLVGVSGQWKDTALPYVGDQYRDLPILGQFYGSKSFNKEAVLSVTPQIIIDVGEKKATIVEDMDQIQTSLDIPTIFIEARLDNMDETYRILGTILNREKEGNALSDYCHETYKQSLNLMTHIQKKPRLLCLVGTQGNMAFPRGAFPAQIIDLLSDNIAVMSQSGGMPMSQTSFEQVLEWNPDVLIIGDETEIDFSALPWRDLHAVKAKRVFRIPAKPYDWMRPPSVNRFMGLSWLAQRLYPEESGIDLHAEMKTYYRLFYHYELSDAECDELLARDRVLP